MCRRIDIEICIIEKYLIKKLKKGFAISMGCTSKQIGLAYQWRHDCVIMKWSCLCLIVYKAWMFLCNIIT